MPAINQIEVRDVHRLTSGQVIVDLATATKELVDNSIDANAKQIEIIFKNYGVDSIECSDDGDGVPLEDHESLAKKHCTSKIACFEDVNTVTTLGFRGEALSSLCSISKVQITTTAEPPKADKLTFDLMGNMASRITTTRNKGTTIQVSNLFYNLPVRQKELVRTCKRQFTKCISLLQAYAIIHNGIQFRVSHLPPSGRKSIMLSTNRTAGMEKKIMSIFGSNSVRGLSPLNLILDLNPFKLHLFKKYATEINIDKLDYKVHVRGSISKSSFGCGRNSKDRQFVYINKRPINYHSIVKCINEVYRSFNNVQYPAFFVDFELSPRLIDVNITPDKRTVVFQHERYVLDVLKDELSKYFESQDVSLPKASFNTNLVEPRTKKFKMEDDRDFDVDYQVNMRASKNCTRMMDMDSSGSNCIDEADTSEPELNQRNETQLHSTLVSDNYNKDGKLANDTKTQTEIHQIGVEEHYSYPQPPLHANSQSLHDSEGEPSDKSTAVSTLDHEPREEILLGIQTSLPTGNIKETPDYRQQKFITDTATFGDEEFDSTKSALLDPDTVNNNVYRNVGDGVSDNNLMNSKCKALPYTLNLDKYSLESPRKSNKRSAEGEDIENRDSIIVNVDGEIFEHSILINQSNNLSSQFTDISPQKKKSNRDDNDSSYDEDEDLEMNQGSQIQETNIRVPLKSFIGDASEGALRSMATLGDGLTTSFQKYNLNLRLDGDASTLIFTKANELGTVVRQKRLAYDESAVRNRATFDLKEIEKGDQYLSLNVKKEDFKKMKVVGQFNLGFIIVIRKREHDHDLFIVDQHASDEKYKFENLQRTTVFKSQRLIMPQPLELSVIDEMLISDNIEIFERNGFKISIDEDASPGERVKILSLPVSKRTLFDVNDFIEIVDMIREDTGYSKTNIRCSKLRAMLAMRACRSSIMIGKPLNRTTMTKVVRNLSELDKPWNCPHGRPTMRHLIELKNCDTFFDDYWF